MALLQQEPEEGITRLERRLYFQTAHGHFKAGCPALALEVLSKLPARVRDERPKQLVTAPSEDAAVIHTGQLVEQHVDQPVKSTQRSRPFVRSLIYVLFCGFLLLFFCYLFRYFLVSSLSFSGSLKSDWIIVMCET